MNHFEKDFDEFLEKKFNDLKIDLETKMNTRSKFERVVDRLKKKDFLNNTIDKEFQDNDATRYDASENKIRNENILNMFSVKHINSNTNYYRKSLQGSPMCVRLNVKGNIYYDKNNEVACKLIVEERNNKIFITEIFVADKYKGYGLAKHLIEIAKKSFGASGAIINKEDLFLLTLFKNCKFIIIGNDKRNYIMDFKEDLLVPIGKPKNQLSSKKFTKQFKGTSDNSIFKTDIENGKNLNLSNMSLKRNQFRHKNDCELNDNPHSNLDNFNIGLGRLDDNEVLSKNSCIDQW